MSRITSLYPQYQKTYDRRQQSIPVAVDRRSGLDRRSLDRVSLDRQLTRDLFEVKKQVAKIEAIAPRFFVDNVVSKSPSFTSMNNLTQDQFVKESKPDPSAQARQEAELQDKASTSFQVGVLSAALAGAIAISFMGTAGAVIAIGTSLYVGARVLKLMMEKELKEEEKINNKN